MLLEIIVRRWQTDDRRMDFVIIGTLSGFNLRVRFIRLGSDDYLFHRCETDVKRMDILIRRCETDDRRMQSDICIKSV